MEPSLALLRRHCEAEYIVMEAAERRLIWILGGLGLCVSSVSDPDAQKLCLSHGTGTNGNASPVSYSRSTAFHFYWENETSNQHASSVPVSSQMIQQTTHALHTMAQPLPPTKSMASTIKSNEERGAAEESGGARFFVVARRVQF